MSTKGRSTNLALALGADAALELAFAVERLDNVTQKLNRCSLLGISGPTVEKLIAEARKDIALVRERLLVTIPRAPVSGELR